MPHTPPKGLMRNFHTKIIMPPDTIPAIAPYLLERFQKRAASITGPNAAPKPAHANDTIPNTELLGSQAITTPRIAITISTDLAISMDCFSERLILNTPLRKFSDILEDAARSCESDVDMVHARMPAKMIPATSAAKTPFSLISIAIFIMTVSESVEALAGSEMTFMLPFFAIVLPITPIRTAIDIEMTTHIEAILLEILILLTSSIAIKRRRICGIPK